jgi:REP element-mobilizing transposase RayT
MSRMRKIHRQLTLDQARRPDGRHGGWRPGAGRPRKAGSISHAKRAALHPRFPQHITLRLRPGVDSMASTWLMKRIRGCIREAHKDTFRIVEFNVLTNHLHLITEAANEQALARGVQGFEVRLARRLNSALKRKGSLFAHRYHATLLTTPTQTRYALRYVLQNRKHHAAEKRFYKNWFDPCSSAAWFDGWVAPLRAATWTHQALLDMDSPTARAATWLLTTGWKRLGLLRLDERPA